VGKWKCAWEVTANSPRLESMTASHLISYSVYEGAGVILNTVAPSITNEAKSVLIMQLYDEEYGFGEE
jgi:hypothetical protein